MRSTKTSATAEQTQNNKKKNNHILWIAKIFNLRHTARCRRVHHFVYSSFLNQTKHNAYNQKPEPLLEYGKQETDFGEYFKMHMTEWIWIITYIELVWFFLRSIFFFFCQFHLMRLKQMCDRLMHFRIQFQTEVYSNSNDIYIDNNKKNEQNANKNQFIVSKTAINCLE